MTKNDCTEQCKGVIKEFKTQGLDFPRQIIVEFEVGGQLYTIRENLVMRPINTIKLGFIPIASTTKSLIEITTGVPAVVGNTVNVRYCPDNPKVAYLPDNDSTIT